MTAAGSLGRHILVEFHGCAAEILDDVGRLEAAMLAAARLAGATVIQSIFHHFSPFGASGVVVIQESHLAIHTWPEYRYAAVDLFTCGDTTDPWVAVHHLHQALGAASHSSIEMRRGSLRDLPRPEQPADLEQQRRDREPVEPRLQRNLWFTDRDDNQAFSLRITGKTLFCERSPFQLVRVMESASHGRFLALDSMLLCTERDEFHYHEMMVHPALQLHPDPQRVLVIGGGDGGTARELLRYPSVRITLVEIDEVVVRASRLHLPSLGSSLDDPRVDLRIGDGMAFVQGADPASYDLILVDGADPTGPAEGLFSRCFLEACERALRPGGLLVAQGASPLFHADAFASLHQTLRLVFGKPRAHVLLFHAPSYPTGIWSHHIASKGDLHPLTDLDDRRADAFSRREGLRYYDAGVHRASFQLPRFVRELLGCGG
jgi:spermidine synthase